MFLCPSLLTLLDPRGRTPASPLAQVLGSCFLQGPFPCTPLSARPAWHLLPSYFSHPVAILHPWHSFTVLSMDCESLGDESDMAVTCRVN